MINNKSVLAFIPARSGSKSIPNKNLNKIAGQEMLGYTIQAAQDSQVCDRIIVSTDDDEISAVARKYGAEVPFHRPNNLASDSAHMIDVIKHGMNWIEKNDQKYDIFLYLQPTNPLRKGHHIQEAFQIFFDNGANSVASVNKTRHIPGRTSPLPEDGRMNNFVDKATMQQNRQELEQYYELNGAIELIRWDVMKAEWNWYGEKSYAYIIPDPYGLDIDTPLDMHFAEFLIKEGYVQ